MQMKNDDSLTNFVSYKLGRLDWHSKECLSYRMEDCVSIGNTNYDALKIDVERKPIR